MDGLREIEFGWFEYVVVFVLLGASVLIGIFYGCFRDQSTVSEYMFGGRNLSAFQISMSIIASINSGIALIGIPSEIYVYGTQFYAIVFSTVAGAIITIQFFLPSIYELKCTSYFEYLEKRFNYTMRSLGCIIYIISKVLWIPIIIYAPSLSFEQVTGISLFYIAPIFCAVCIFYTSLGGLKAIVWTDVLQNVFTLVAVLGVMCLGLSSVGGFWNVYESNLKGERLELFNFDFNPFKRNTFPTVFIGETLFRLAFFAADPATFQRLAAVPTYRKAKWALTWTAIGSITVHSIMTIIGLIMYSKYHGCDPVVTKKVQKSGQLIIYYVVDLAKDYPGLSGLFISGVVAASLSSVSTYINTVALLIYEDLLKTTLSPDITEKKVNLIMKALTIVVGVGCTAMIYVIEKMGTIYQINIALGGVTNGAIVYIFSLGMFVPWANSKGAVVGAIASLVSTFWLVTGAQLAEIHGDLRFPGKITSIDDCPDNSTLHYLNSTEFGLPGYGTKVEAAKDLPLAYQISYYYIGFIGFAVGMVVGTIVSFLTGNQDFSKLDHDLIAPQLRFLLPKKRDKNNRTYSVVNLEDEAEDRL